MNRISDEEILFFTAKPETLPLYERLREAITGTVEGTEIEVKKTQVSFKKRHLFAAVSFTPVRRLRERPPVFLTLTLGLHDPLPSPRVDAAVEVYPNRWTHHITISRPEEIDEELLGWIEEAAWLAAGKR